MNTYLRPRNEAEKVGRRLARYREAIDLVESGEARPRVVEAVELLREGLTGIEIAERMGLARSTAYQLLNDPTDEENRARKARHHGTCKDCGGPTFNGGALDVPLRCQPCAIAYQKANVRWTPQAITEAIRRWAREYGAPPTSTQWNASMLRDLGRFEEARRWEAGDYPATNTVVVTVGWADALRAAGFEPHRQMPRGHGPHTADNAETLRFFEQGHSRDALAARYGVTEQAIGHRLKRARGEPVASPLKAVDIIDREIEKNKVRQERLREEIDLLESEQKNLAVAKAALNGAAAKS